MAGIVLSPCLRDQETSLICSCHSSNPKRGIHDPHCSLYPYCRLCGGSVDLCKRFNLSGCARVNGFGNMAEYQNGTFRWHQQINSCIKNKYMQLNSLFSALYQTGRVPQSTFVSWDKKVAELRAACEKKAPALDDVKNAEKNLLRLRRFYLNAKSESEKPIAPPQKVEDDSHFLDRSYY